ncbi:hypothetical protein BB559_005892 [Furculomyces boomerangus]|uniref:Major facilitator superfamily (MFS) profile domain-containing protein n=1 Tax=Furculomyces boomerangus TaxID=61424 RepID=A0A2T9Y658_9FUNG|nr:hypothetical protein BB559_005892 [Furculomyces boomerangus]
MDDTQKDTRKTSLQMPLILENDLSESTSNRDYDENLNSFDPGTLENSKLTKFCIFCGLVVSLASFQFGYKMSELNNPKDAIINCGKSQDPLNAKLIAGYTSALPKCLPMSETYFGVATSIFAIGGLIGSLASGPFVSKYGRKKTLMFNSTLFFIGSVFETFATKPIMLVLGRFISGIGSGVGIVVAPMYLTEIAPMRYRGLLNLFNQMNIVFGIFVAQVLGYVFGTVNHWRLVLGFGILASLINGVTMLMVVESPRHFFNLSDFRSAENILIKLRGTSDVSEELKGWMVGHRNSSVAQTNNADTGVNNSRNGSSSNNEYSGEQYIDEIGQTEPKITLFSIFRMKKYYHSLILVATLQIGQQFSGINTVFFYSNTIFSKMFSQNMSSILTLMIGLVNVIFTLIAVFIVDRIPRRKLLFTSMIMMFLSLGLQTVSMFAKINALSVISLFMIIVSFAPGYGPLPFLISTEVFDSQAIAAGNSFSLGANWIGTFILGVSFLSMNESLGNYTFIVFMFFLVVFGVFYYFYLPETKNKTFGEVSEEFVF